MALGKAFSAFELEKKLYKNQKNLEGTATPDLSCEEQSELLDYLPEFFVWLGEQIHTANYDEQFILGKIPHGSVESENHPKKTIIFLRVELLEQYSGYSGVSVFTIHEALRQALSISHLYTIERDDQIIEVTPCLYPLYYNLCSDLTNS